MKTNHPALPLAALLSMAVTGMAAPATLSFRSGGKPISVEAFHPPAGERAPALIVLHGASGPLAGNEYVRQLAGAFALQGYATFLVHYFDRTGTTYAGDALIRQNYEIWRQTIGEAVDFVAKQPGVDPKRIALMGYSLGGYLSVTHAGRDPRVRAVIEIAGGLDDETRSRSKKMPPVLVIHGEADRRVPVEEGRKLESWLSKLGGEHETHFYPGEGHLLSPRAALEALALGKTFLDKHLR